MHWSKCMSDLFYQTHRKSSTPGVKIVKSISIQKGGEKAWVFISMLEKPLGTVIQIIPQLYL